MYNIIRMYNINIAIVIEWVSVILHGYLCNMHMVMTEVTFIRQYYLTARQLLIIRSLSIVTGSLVLPKCLEYYGGHYVEIRELQVGTETSIQLI